MASSEDELKGSDSYIPRPPSPPQRHLSVSRPSGLRRFKPPPFPSPPKTIELVEPDDVMANITSDKEDQNQLSDEVTTATPVNSSTEDLKLQLPENDGMETSDEDIHRLTARKPGSSDGSSSEVDTECDIDNLLELETAREESHKEVEQYILKANADVEKHSLSSDGDCVKSSESFTPDKIPDSVSIHSSDTDIHKNSSKNGTVQVGIREIYKSLQNDRNQIPSRKQTDSHSEDDYFHHMPHIPLRGQDTDVAKFRRRQRKHRHRLNPMTNRLSDNVKKFNQYKNIWEDIYDQHNLDDAPTETDSKEKSWCQSYTAPLVCPLPVENNEFHLAEPTECLTKENPNPVLEFVLQENQKALKHWLKGNHHMNLNSPLDTNGWTVLHLAVRFSNLDICRILIQHGAFVTSHDSVQSWTPLHIASMTPDIQLDIIDLLLDFPDGSMILNQTDAQGRTALHLGILSITEILASKELQRLDDLGLMDDMHYSLLKIGDPTVGQNTSRSKEKDTVEELMGQALSDRVAYESDVSARNSVIGMSPENVQSASWNESNPCLESEASLSDSAGYQPDDCTYSSEADLREALQLNLPTDDSNSENDDDVCPLYSHPEMALATPRVSTTIYTFRANSTSQTQTRALFEKDEESSSCSTIDECVAVIEAFDLSPEEDDLSQTSDNEACQDPSPSNSDQYLPHTIEKIKHLIELGSNVDLLDYTNNSVLHYAAWVGSTELVQELIDRNVNVLFLNKEQQTALHVAVRIGKIDIINILVEKCSNLNQVDLYGNTPVDLFIFEHIRKKEQLITPWLKNLDYQMSRNKALETLEYLLQHGGRVTNIVSLDHLIQNTEPDKLESLTERCSQNLDFEAKNFQQQNLLHVTSLRPFDPDHIGCIAMTIHFLANNGVRLNSQDINGRTALHLACRKRNLLLVDTLLSLEADLHVCDNFGHSALHYAVMDKPQILPNWYNFSDFHLTLAETNDPKIQEKEFENQIKIVELLIKSGSDPNKGDCNGRTPLHLAVEYSDKIIAECLLAHGANLEATDGNSLTPITYIVKLRKRELYHLVYTPDKKSRPHSASLRHNLERCKDLPPFAKPIIPAAEQRSGDCLVDILEEARHVRGEADRFIKTLLNSPGIGHVLFVEENARIRGEMFTLMQRLSSAISEFDVRLASTPQIAGSVQEDTKVGEATEFDYIFELVHFKQAFIVHTQDRGNENNSNNGNIHEYGISAIQKTCTLKLQEGFNVHDCGNGSLQSFCDHEGILHGTPVAVAFSTAVHKSLSQSSLWSDLHFLWEDEVELGANFVTFPCMIQLKWMGSKYRDLLLNVDIVPSIKLACIENNISQRPVKNTKQQSWTKKTHSKINKELTVLIKWDGDSKCDTHLVQSFSEAENDIFQGLPDFIKDGYCLAKIIKNTNLAQQQGPPMETYLLKTVLFWLLYPRGEPQMDIDLSWIIPLKDPPPRYNDRVEQIRLVAYHLYHRLETHVYSAYLSSFFIKGCNLLEGIDASKDSLTDICMVAKALLSD